MKNLLLSLLLLFSTSVLDYAETIKFVYARYYPANYRDDDGNHRGFFIDIIKELFEKRLGISVSVETLPWARCQLMVKQGTADMIATIPTEERREYTKVVEPPIWIKRYQLYTFADNPDKLRIDAIRSTEDLRLSGLRVMSYIGNSWSKTELEDAGIPVINSFDIQGMYRMLAARRADILIEDPLLAAKNIVSFGLSRTIVLTGGVIGESRFNLLVGKKSIFADSVPFMERELDKMAKDGTMKRIVGVYQ